MTKEQTGPVPVEIGLQKKSRTLDIIFDDGASFSLPCRYLRMYSPSAEVRAARNRGEKIVAAEGVNIEHIEPVGTYAIRLKFSDGHETGVYSWSTLYRLGKDMGRNWSLREEPAEADGTEPLAPDTDFSQWLTIRILYFGSLVDQIERSREEVQIPPSVRTVQSLIDWLARRGTYWETSLRKNPVKVTINRQFAELKSEIAEGDEIAFVPIVAGSE